MKADINNMAIKKHYRIVFFFALIKFTKQSSPAPTEIFQALETALGIGVPRIMIAGQ